MAEPLADFRGKLTQRTDAVLEAINRASGRDKSEITREVMDKWAEEQIHAATLITRLTRDEGGTGAS